ncbi:MAG: F0F1 ATP synthase subunit gamma [Epsilonproteobacteria bacterium]|nr:F0F1 ATP synthase subunit gamma [Campylobacterota bacterium]
MSVLVQIKQKIKATQVTKKITHAIRLVSMSLYTRLDRQTQAFETYNKEMQDMFAQLIPCCQSWDSDILFPKDTKNTTPLIVVVASSKGLCGSFNSNLFRYAQAKFNFTKEQRPYFIIIGQKAFNFVHEQKRAQILSSYKELNSNNFIAVADDVLDKIISARVPFSSVTFFCNGIKNFFAQFPQEVSLIPFQSHLREMDQSILEAQSSLFAGREELIWEQKHHDILDYTASRFLRSSIVHILFQSLRAEYAARFLAMESSTKNADKYLETLTLQYNKIRQSLITKEVAELSAGFLER